MREQREQRGKISNQLSVISMSNLVDWTPLMTNVFGADGTFMVVDAGATDMGRFYRLRVP